MCVRVRFAAVGDDAWVDDARPLDRPCQSREIENDRFPSHSDRRPSPTTNSQKAHTESVRWPLCVPSSSRRSTASHRIPSERRAAKRGKGWRMRLWGVTQASSRSRVNDAGCWIRGTLDRVAQLTFLRSILFWRNWFSTLSVPPTCENNRPNGWRPCSTHGGEGGPTAAAPTPPRAAAWAIKHCSRSRRHQGAAAGGPCWARPRPRRSAAPRRPPPWPSCPRRRMPSWPRRRGARPSPPPPPRPCGSRSGSLASSSSSTAGPTSATRGPLCVGVCVGMW